MRQIRLFTPQPLTVDVTVTLDDAAGHHLARVLRARVGDPVTLFNGEGHDYVGAIAGISKKAVQVSLTEKVTCENRSPLRAHLGLCISKGDRFDWAIQKATELGVEIITPLLSDRVDVKLPADRMAKKVAHWQGVVRNACEQCYRGYVPEIHEPQGLAAWVRSVDADLKLVLHHHNKVAGLPTTIPESVALLIGPEGGLSEEEVSIAETAGFNRWCIGPRVLRTETAPVVALTALGMRWGDLG